MGGSLWSIKPSFGDENKTEGANEDKNIFLSPHNVGKEILKKNTRP